jgi:hypothetical protein
LLLPAGVSLIAKPAFSQPPPAAPPAKFETTKVADGVYTFRYLFHRNVFLVTSDGVIATDPISPDAAAARGSMAALTQARTDLRGWPAPDPHTVVETAVCRPEGRR